MTFTECDHRAFVDYETKAWVRLAPHYDDMAGRMTRQVASPILDAAGLTRDMALLDVASGPGYVAASARQRGARPTGVDFSPDMIAAARANCPGIAFEQGDAEALPFAAESFDAVTCAFGMLHFAQPGRALAEAHRVLRPGGRFAFAVWRIPPKGSLFSIITESVQKGLVLPVEAPTGPGPYMMGDPMVCTAMMDAARFTDVRIVDLPCAFTLETSDDLFDFMLKCAVRATYIYERQPTAARARIERALRAEGAAAMATNGRTVPCPALLVSGSRAER